MDDKGCKRWLEHALNLRPTNVDGGVRVGIEHVEDRKIVGILSFWYYGSTRQQGGLRILIHRDYQRRGFGLEALDAMLTFCFRDLGLHRVTVACDTRNAAAVGLLTKAGMRREGECRKDRFVDGTWAYSVWFAMLEEELPETPQES